MKKTLPSLRISDETFNKIERSIAKHNKTSLSKLSLQEFRRTALELLSQAILQDAQILELID